MSKSSCTGAFTGAATIRAPRAPHRFSFRDLKLSLEEEDCRARLVAEKLLEEGLARVSEAAEIAEEHDVAAAAAIIAEEGVECVWVERGFTK